MNKFVLYTLVVSVVSSNLYGMDCLKRVCGRLGLRTFHTGMEKNEEGWVPCAEVIVERNEDKAIEKPYLILGITPPIFISAPRDRAGKPDRLLLEGYSAIFKQYLASAGAIYGVNVYMNTAPSVNYVCVANTSDIVAQRKQIEEFVAVLSVAIVVLQGKWAEGSVACLEPCRAMLKCGPFHIEEGLEGQFKRLVFDDVAESALLDATLDSLYIDNDRC